MSEGGEGVVMSSGGKWDDETKSRINPFDWDSKSAGFGEIIENGGFDVVIGNPPYVRIQAMKEWAPVEVEFYKRQYVSASKGNYDIYVVFVKMKDCRRV
jgi:methylase of polypeptide subunit release factors